MAIRPAHPKLSICLYLRPNCRCGSLSPVLAKLVEHPVDFSSPHPKSTAPTLPPIASGTLSRLETPQNVAHESSPASIPLLARTLQFARHLHPDSPFPILPRSSCRTTPHQSFAHLSDVRRDVPIATIAPC